MGGIFPGFGADPHPLGGPGVAVGRTVRMDTVWSRAEEMHLVCLRVGRPGFDGRRPALLGLCVCPIILGRCFVVAAVSRGFVGNDEEIALQILQDDWVVFIWVVFAWVVFIWVVFA